MNVTTNVFTSEEIRLLEHHLGSRIDSLAGNGLPEYLTSTEILIVTNRGTLHLWCDSVVYDFQSFADDFSTWRLDEEPLGLAEATDRDERYFSHQGEEILGIEIVRETVREVSFGEPTWEYTTDVALVFQLTCAKLVVSRPDLNIELLNARFVESGDDAEILPSDAYWVDSPQAHHDVKRIRRPIQEFLSDPD